MIDFIQNLKERNETLFFFGLVCLVFSFFFLILTKVTNTQVFGVNALLTLIQAFKGKPLIKQNHEVSHMK